MASIAETSMRILLVEDEMEVARSISRKLCGSGFPVDHVSTVDEVLTALTMLQYALVLLDRRLPDGDGLLFIPKIRQMQPGIRILMLSAYDDTDDVVSGLDLGADDYLTKPFKFAELMARIRAALRRPGGDSLPPIVVGDLVFSLQFRDVSVRGVSVILHRRELMLLEALMRRAERMVTRQTLIEEVYGFGEDGNQKALNLLILRLRRRLNELDARAIIHVARGVGYMIGKARP